MIDLDHAVIVDVEATTAVRQAEVTAQRRMIERTRERFGLWPERLVADGGYGDAANLAWLVEEHGIEPHIPVFDKSARRDGTFERADFVFDHEDDSYVCPAGNRLRPRNRNFAQPRSLADADGFIRYRARQQDCSSCNLKARCTPNMPARKVTRSIHEGARDMARDISKTDAYAVSRRQRKKVEMLFAHLKRILGLGRLRLRGPNGARWPSSSRNHARLQRKGPLAPISQAASDKTPATSSTQSGWKLPSGNLAAVAMSARQGTGRTTNGLNPFP